MNAFTVPEYRTRRVYVRPVNRLHYITGGWANYLGPYTDGDRVYNADHVKHDADMKPYVEIVERIA